MKKLYTIILLSLISFLCFSQDTEFKYTGTYCGAKSFYINKAQTITDISPDFWNKVGMKNNDRRELTDRKKNSSSQAYFYSEQDYNRIIDIISTSVTVTKNGERVSSKSKSEVLTSEQKELLKNAGMGSNIYIEMKFKYKEESPSTEKNKLIHAELFMTVVPDTEAEYPGGNKEFNAHINKNFINKLTDTDLKNLGDSKMNFTINETGEITNIKTSGLENSFTMNLLLLQTIKNMPKWKPAQTSDGKKIKQEFSIALRSGC